MHVGMIKKRNLKHFAFFICKYQKQINIFTPLTTQCKVSQPNRIVSAAISAGSAKLIFTHFNRILKWQIMLLRY